MKKAEGRGQKVLFRRGFKPLLKRSHQIENLVGVLKGYNRDTGIPAEPQDHIQVRLYGATNGEFLHAKAYIFDDYSIVGSSNFTPSGIYHNRELNVVNKQRAIAQHLRHDWFTEFWNHESVDVDYKIKLIDVLNASKFGSKAYTPYQVFLKALYELFKDDTIIGEGDRTSLELANFQQEGFERAVRLIERHNGCVKTQWLCYCRCRRFEENFYWLAAAGLLPN